jgi:hypothetical protein
MADSTIFCPNQNCHLHNKLFQLCAMRSKIVIIGKKKEDFMYFYALFIGLKENIEK